MAKLYHISQLSSEEKIEKYRHNADFLYHELFTTRHLCSNLNEIVESYTDGIFVTDGNAVMLWLNRAYEAITGVPREKILGKSTQIMADYYSFRAVCSVMCAKQKKSITLEQTLKNSGKKVLVSCRPLFDDSGNVSIIIGTLRDISELDSLKMTLSEAAELSNRYREAYDAIKKQLVVFPDIVAQDQKMVDTLYLARRVSATDVPVLLTGESGSGKGEIAKFIHSSSPRKEGPFITINCGAIPPSLMESELFGYEKGAFTGADQRGKPGLLEVAEQGSVFLDEIGELPLDMQVKLLRVLESQEITRVGGVNPIKLNIRLICATNRDLNKMVELKQFRLDLLYRVNTMTIKIPPLRERPGDIPPLVDAFLSEANQKFGFHKRMSPLAFRILYDYKWPGNVRELKNCIERVLISTESDTIVESDLQPVLFPRASNDFSSGQRYSLKSELERLELKYMEDTYATHKSIRKASEMLGMTPSTFQRRRAELMRKYDSSCPGTLT
jgi:PAS domain S-box-containing protein